MFVPITSSLFIGRSFFCCFSWSSITIITLVIFFFFPWRFLLVLMIFLGKKSVRERRGGGGFTSTAPATAGIKASTDYFVFLRDFQGGKEKENWGQDDFEHILIHLARKSHFVWNEWMIWVSLLGPGDNSKGGVNIILRPCCCFFFVFFTTSLKNVVHILSFSVRCHLKVQGRVAVNMFTFYSHQ